MSQALHLAAIDLILEPRRSFELTTDLLLDALGVMTPNCSVLHSGAKGGTRTPDNLGVSEEL